MANVYCPNDHVQSREFMDGVYDRINDLMDRHPDAFLVLGGDFNACMSDNDSLNRIGTANEKIITGYFKSNNITCEVLDSLKQAYEYQTFTSVWI